MDLLPGSVAVPAGLEPAIAAAWAAAQGRAGGRLFDGRVFSVSELAPDRIAGQLVAYRLVVAAYADPGLAAALRLRPLSVCGVLRMPDGILFGRRQRGATYEAGLWQTPPAGSVDAGAVVGNRVDVVGQLRAELAEEVGLDWGRITGCRAVTLVEHAATGVHDLAFLLDTPAGFAEVAARHAATGCGEYTELRAVPEAALAGFIAAAAGRMVPAAPLFLRAAGLLADGA
ncbi:NUDIX hydrolase [Dankookia sp. GCM10030260]|uniref:NUDIX hydrolase n=1 Tax=Dankookia sp. GCM10030260 TaxID=3273390 RepID=UPI00361C6878